MDCLGPNMKLNPQNAKLGTVPRIDVEAILKPQNVILGQFIDFQEMERLCLISNGPRSMRSCQDKQF